MSSRASRVTGEARAYARGQVLDAICQNSDGSGGISTAEIAQASCYCGNIGLSHRQVLAIIHELIDMGEPIRAREVRWGILSKTYWYLSQLR